MNDWSVIILILLISIGLAWPLGKYMARVYSGKNCRLKWLSTLENFIFSACRIDPGRNMNWKQYLGALFAINAIWLTWGFVILVTQHQLPLNPADIPSMEWTLALNSSISFLTSTNLQHYSGETGASYFSQVFVFMFLQFVSAAASMAVGVAVVRGIKKGSAGSLGNFYKDLVLSLTRILLPLCIITAMLFAVRGVPMTFDGPDKLVTLQEDTVQVSRGPVAAFLPIKELGSNGGGFFGANDAHPFENPDIITFIIHSIIVFLLPIAFVFMIGYYLQKKKFTLMLFLVMFIGFLAIMLPVIHQEVQGNPAISKMGIAASAGNMEGKESRFGTALTAFYCGENVVIPAGTVSGMHDSFMPLSGVYMLLGMQIDAFFGGVGTGWLNMFIFIIVAIFISTLMIGRTPELFGKKISIPEIQSATIVLLLQPLLYLSLTAIACYTLIHFPGGNGALGWLNNPSSHGFTTMLYEYTSSYAGNGSGFEGLGDNTPFWNLTTSLAMLGGRFIPITGAVCIAGLLSYKRNTPPSTGTLKADSVSFAVFLLFVIVILQILSFFPALIIGPIAEQVLM